MFLVHLAFAVILSAVHSKGFTVQNIWQGYTVLHLLLQFLFLLGIFLFPSAILATAAGKDMTFLRPDYLLFPILIGLFYRHYNCYFKW